MIRIKHWTKDPSGQVLLATLLFCFTFVALFVGLYKSGMLYNAKERAIRASNLTALSAGAVYSNGMQLVRVTNVILLAAAALNLVALFTIGDMTAGLAYLLPNSEKLWLIKAVQGIQKILFGIDEPIGIYPFLIAQETISVASQNGLKSTYPSLNSASWSPAIPPSLVLLFNIKTLGPDLAQALVPNMALKFRTADFFLNAIPKQKKFYKYTSEDGKTYYFDSDEVKIANKSKNEGQMRVKAGTGQRGAGKFVTEDVSNNLSKLNPIMKFANLLAGIQLDVTDRDIPAIHNVFVYANYPTSIKDTKNNNAEIQTLSQVNVEGTGLAAWDVNDPFYQSTLVSTDPTELIKQISIQSFINQAMKSFIFPSISNILGKIFI